LAVSSIPPMTYAANLGRDQIIKKLRELGATDLMSALGGDEPVVGELPGVVRNVESVDQV
jgi:hypothetical protein